MLVLLNRLTSAHTLGALLALIRSAPGEPMDVSPWSVSTTSDFPPITALDMATRIEIYCANEKRIADSPGFSCEEGASTASVRAKGEPYVSSLAYQSSHLSQKLAWLAIRGFATVSRRNLGSLWEDFTSTTI